MAQQLLSVPKLIVGVPIDRNADEIALRLPSCIICNLLQRKFTATYCNLLRRKLGPHSGTLVRLVCGWPAAILFQGVLRPIRRNSFQRKFGAASHAVPSRDQGLDR